MEYNSLVKKRGVVKAALTRFATKVDENNAIQNIPALKERLKKFEPNFEKYSEIQEEIDAIVEQGNDADKIFVEITERDEFESEYFRVVGKARNIIEKVENSPDLRIRAETSLSEPLTINRSVSRADEAFNNHTMHNLHLPKLSVPKFDGTHSKWVKFRDSFQSLIHNNSSLSDIRKFHYLDDALEGKAASVISSLGISENNYSVAWERLTSRYEDESELIYYHLNDIFKAPRLNKTSADDLRTLIDTFSNNLAALKTLKEPTDSWGSMIMYLLTSKLNSEIQSEMDKELAKLSDRPTLKNMTDFLEKHCKFLSKRLDKSNVENERKGSSKGYSSKNSAKSYAITTENKACAFCNGDHYLFACSDFKKMNPVDRYKKVRELKICCNCLKQNSSEHSNANCPFGPCRKCNKKHNSLVHIDNFTPNSQRDTQAPEAQDVAEDTKKNYSVQTSNNSNKSYSILATAIIYVYDKNGKQHEARTYLDSCSQAHLITKSLCRRLDLDTSGTSLLSGIEHGSKPAEKATVQIKSRITGFKKTITCLVLNEIDNEAPSKNLNTNDIQIPKGIKLADPLFDKSKPVDLLLGVGLFYELLCVGRIHLKENQPFIQKTLLGWIIAGDLNLPEPSVSKPKCFLIKNTDLNNQLKQFWEIEHTFLLDPHATKLQQTYAEQHFVSTVERDEFGKFIVSIPFQKNSMSLLGMSKMTAQKRLFSMEQKLEKNLDLKEQYHNFMNEYESLGHMTKINNPDDNIPHFYLPHHAVTKEESTTTKLRVVFDGSSKSSTGISLNAIQDIGVPVQDDLFSIILRSRLKPIVLSADIAKMYRQILIKQNERSMQRILWRSNPNEPISTYELNTVTYGTASAPFLATRCLKAIGEACTNEFPNASSAILHDFYVDDLLSGADTVEAAIELKNQLTDIFNKAGMQLRKWASNDPRVSDFDKNDATISLNGEKDPKTLGLLWDPKNDILKYKFSCDDDRKVTKASILSAIFKIFDPLGLVGPAIIEAKILMQELWKLELDWKESLPQNLHLSWKNLCNDMYKLNETVIARNVVPLNSKIIEIHCFCDSSENAYGACIYACSINKEGVRSANLLCAKSRVAPLSTTSIPRLELQSALLLAQLAHKVSVACNIPKEKFYYWNDSKVALAWIKSPSSKWKTVVALRTAEIQQLSNENWNHVISGENPADIISRGMPAAELNKSDLWWHGPEWLCKDSSSWPSLQIGSEENNKVYKITMQQLNDDLQINPNEFTLFDRFSSFHRLYRVVSFMFRFVKNCRESIKKRAKNNIVLPNTKSVKELITSSVLPLTVQEIESSKIQLIKIAQYESFHVEINLCKMGKGFKSSKLNQLTPFLDKQGLLRVGGRLGNTDLPYDKKHPIILSPNHKLTHLIIENEHRRLLHAGCQLVMSSLRNHFWPLSCKNIVKFILRKCVTCFKCKPRDSPHIMGNLPLSRVTPARPFFNCGVDFTGHFFLKETPRSRSSVKAYVCIFVCFATKAVHIELAKNLSTEAFINCFKRFVSRRGLCKHIFSDNGSNFVGAEKDLQAHIFSNISKNKIIDELTEKKVEWHFNPPSAPHFGGLWESAVKSAKFHLKRIIGETRLTYEELYTILTQIEACLNSRPISPLSNDPNDFTPLTPGHFLIGDSLTAVPQEDMREVKMNRLTRFGLQQQIVQHFWQRWSSEYLPNLQTRLKWKKLSTQKITIGAMVLIKEDNVPPLQWALGRIIQVHPGRDDVIRVVSIQVAKGIIQRPVAKICILPIESDDEQTSSEEQGDSTN